MKNKKLFLIVLFVIGIMVTVSGCEGSAQTQDSSNSSKKEVTVRFGADSSAFSTAFYVARDKGYFKKYGINAQINPYSFGIDTVDAVLTNQVDVGLAMDFAALSRLSSGDLKIFSFIQQTDASKEKIVTRDGINFPKELKEKSIAVKRGTVDGYAMVRYLEKYGIKINQVNKQGFSSDAEIISAFQKGDVQASFFTGNLLDKALTVKGTKVIGSKEDIPFASRGFLMANNKFLTQKDVTKNILLALNDAVKYINEDPSGAAETVSQDLKVPKDALEKDIKSRKNDIRLNDQDVEQLRDVYKFSSTNKLIKGGFDLKSKINTDSLKEALPQKLTYKSEDVK